MPEPFTKYGIDNNELNQNNLFNVDNVSIFYTRREDWTTFRDLLDEWSIQTLVHITDASNLPSIIKYGGLYSKEAMTCYHIPEPTYVSSDISRYLNVRRGTNDYIHLSFLPSPMSKHIMNPVELKVNTKFIYAKETHFSDMNSIDGNATIGDKFEDFQRIKFQIIKEWRGKNENPQTKVLMEHYASPHSSEAINKEPQTVIVPRRVPNESQYIQAEVLVKHHIPIDYITLP